MFDSIHVLEPSQWDGYNKGLITYFCDGSLKTEIRIYP